MATVYGTRRLAPIWLAAGMGTAMALLVLGSPPAAFIFRLAVAFGHELGHAAAGWLMAHPSLPVIDFAFGGGVTLMGERSPVLLGLIVLAFVWQIYKHRRNRRRLLLLTILACAYAVAQLTPLGGFIILAAGHGAELLLAGAALFLALDSTGERGLVRRGLLAFAAAFILMADSAFAYRLMTSPVFGQQYSGLSSTGFHTDFSQLAIAYLHVDVSWVACGFLAACLLTPPVAFATGRRLRRRQARASAQRASGTSGCTQLKVLMPPERLKTPENPDCSSMRQAM